MFLSDNTFPLFKDMCDSLTWLVSLSAPINHAGQDSKLLLMLSTTLLCLPKSKLNFKLKLRCHLFSGSVISFSDCRSVTPKSLYHFSVSQRLVCKVFPLTYNIAPVSLSGLISTNYFMHLNPRHSDSLSNSQSCHIIFSFLYLCTCSSFCQIWPDDLPFSQLERFLHIL